MQSDSRVMSQGLPKFIPDASNVALSFNYWLGQFKVELALIAARAGKTPGEDPVDIYNDHLRLLSLFSAIGPTGVSALEATGYDTNDPLNTYNDALTRLKVIYDRKKTIFVSIQRFLLAKQKVGEDGLNYLLRVEKCTREAGYNSPTDVDINAEIPEASGPIKDKVRQLMVRLREADRSRMATVVAVNGLCNQSLRSRLMANEDLS